MRGREALLYGIENDAIFLEGTAHAVGQQTRGLRIIGQNVAHLKPIVTGVLLIHGGQEIVRVHDEGGLVMLGFRAAGARGHEHGLDERMTRIADFVVLQSVAHAGETNEGNIDGRDVDLAHPAKRGHAGRVCLDLYRLGFAGGVAERTGMNPGNVRWIEQIVSHVEVIAIDRHRIAAGDSPGGIAVMVDAEYGRRLRQLRIAHPDPQQAVARDNGIAAHVRSLRNAVGTGQANALSAAIIGHAVISAFDVVAFDASHGQRQFAVHAGVFERNRTAVGFAVQHDPLIQHFDRHEPVRELNVQGRHVPCIAQEHLVSLVNRLMPSVRRTLVRRDAAPCIG